MDVDFMSLIERIASTENVVPTDHCDKTLKKDYLTTLYILWET